MGKTVISTLQKGEKEKEHFWHKYVWRHLKTGFLSWGLFKIYVTLIRRGRGFPLALWQSIRAMVQACYSGEAGCQIFFEIALCNLAMDPWLITPLTIGNQEIILCFVYISVVFNQCTNYQSSQKVALRSLFGMSVR